MTANTSMPKLYFFPWITRATPDNEPINLQTGESFHDSSFQLVIDFNNLPVVSFKNKFLISLLNNAQRS